MFCFSKQHLGGDEDNDSNDYQNWKDFQSTAKCLTFMVQLPQWKFLLRIEKTYFKTFLDVNGKMILKTTKSHHDSFF